VRHIDAAAGEAYGAGMHANAIGFAPSHSHPRRSLALLGALLLAATAGCGGSSGGDANPPPAITTCPGAGGDTACVCTSAGYGGDILTNLDGLGRLDPSTDTLLNDAPWVDDTGTWRSCTQNATAALESACVSLAGRQSHLLGATPSGSSILVHRAAGAGCGVSRVWLFDGTLGPPQSYAGVDITDLLAADSFDLSDGQRLTLSPDGLTVIGLSAGDLQSVTRANLGPAAYTFGAVSTSAFAVVNAALGPIGSVALSTDGLHLYVTVDGSPGTLWEATRSSPTAAFEGLTLLPGSGAGQINDGTFGAVTGATEGGRTVLVTKAFATYVFTRPAAGGTYAPANGGASFPIWFAHPVAGCTYLLGTVSPGGCASEGIGLFAYNW
jgi:hypothetical protein